MSTHFNLRFFQCELCDASFSRKWTLKKHLFTHTGEKPFACDICHKKFSDKSNLSTHYKKHEKKSTTTATPKHIANNDNLNLSFLVESDFCDKNMTLFDTCTFMTFPPDCKNGENEDFLHSDKLTNCNSEQTVLNTSVCSNYQPNHFIETVLKPSCFKPSSGKNQICSPFEDNKEYDNNVCNYPNAYEELNFQGDDFFEFANIDCDLDDQLDDPNKIINELFIVKDNNFINNNFSLNFSL